MGIPKREEHAMKTGRENRMNGFMLLGLLVFVGVGLTPGYAQFTGGVGGGYASALSPEGPLPVQLASFHAQLTGTTSVRLDWMTISELNNYGFYVQRKSSQEPAFVELANAFIPGHGTTNVPQQYSYVDQGIYPAVWYYRLKQVDLDGTVHFTEPISVEILTSVDESLPEVFSLSQNYPNPFNPSTSIRFQLPIASEVTLKVYDVLGREVSTLVSGATPAGSHTVRWDASGLASGVYLYRLQAGTFVETKNLLLVK